MKKQLTTIVALLLLSVAFAGVAQALPLSSFEVEIDDTALQPGSSTRLNLERGDEFEVEVRIVSTVDIDDVEVEAFVSGYEYNDDSRSRISDVTSVFDMEANVSYVKRLDLRLPSDADRDDYKVRVIVSDRYGDEELQNYNIKLEAQRHDIIIDDVILNPASEVRAGSALFTIVRLENFGQDEEDDVKVTVSMPALGISAADYLDEVKDDDQKNSEELYLRIPRCAEEGMYDVVVDVDYNRGRGSDTRVLPIRVTSDDTCTPSSAGQTDGPKTMITLGSQVEQAEQGGSIIFPITLTNQGNAARSYTVAIASQDWADVQLSPASTVVVEPGRSQTVNAFVTVKEDAPAGPQTLTATVSSGVDKLEDLTLTVNVQEAKSSAWSTLKRVLIVALLVLVALLVILGLIIGISRMKDQGEEGSSAQTYY